MGGAALAREPRSEVRREPRGPARILRLRPALDRADAVEWHVNFADPSLFVAYGSRLFAQDEMQVAEHPALGSLKEALVARESSRGDGREGQPTPVIVMGALRHCRVATEPNAAEGRPHGLYGNAFARADPRSGASGRRRESTRRRPRT